MVVQADGAVQTVHATHTGCRRDSTQNDVGALFGFLFVF